MSQSEARRKRRMANRRFIKESSFLKSINIPETYVKVCLNLDHGLTEYRKSILLLYVTQRRKLDPGFDNMITDLDNLIEKSIKDKLKDIVNE